MTTQSTYEQIVQISGDAHKTLADHLRRWSGWAKAPLLFGDPSPVSPFARTNFDTGSFMVNPDLLVRNPNRVLNTVTPFRLRQEAVLTGVLLHEAGHARYSLWQPRNQADYDEMVSKYSKQAIALARLCEEARIEGLVKDNEASLGARGLTWTMRASATALLPMTDVSTDPNQMVMDVIESWVLRAGRVIAQEHAYYRPNWVGDFNNLLADVLHNHLDGPPSAAPRVMELLTEMVRWDGTASTTGSQHTYPFMVTAAQEVLDILFPDGDAPMPEDNCTGGMEGDPADADKEESESGAGGSGQDSDGEAAGEGTEEAAGATSSTDEDSADGEGQGEGDEGSEGEDEKSETESRLAALEQTAEKEAEAEEQNEQAKAPTQPMEGESDQDADGKPSGGAGAGSGITSVRGYRQPNVTERDLHRGAEKFLRDMLDPATSSTVTLSESPSATVDGAALAAWKAGGQVRDPRFFRRTKRSEAPTPPVKIAVLVDVSSSMNVLQHPSAVLSWALSAAALDLRNFAGRGQKIETTLIHWGNEARVIAPRNALLPGIKLHACDEGTSAMHHALDLVADEIPGFFDFTDEGKPENRLLVQFTDWQLMGSGQREGVAQRVGRAFEVGVNMLSVVPPRWTARYGSLNEVVKKARVQRGGSYVVAYNEAHPESVWTEAARVLAGGVSDTSNTAAADNGMFA